MSLAQLGFLSSIRSATLALAESVGEANAATSLPMSEHVASSPAFLVAAGQWHAKRVAAEGRTRSPVRDALVSAFCSNSLLDNNLRSVVDIR